ncbi:MAG: response regulator [Desulfovibrio sp.]
MKVLIIETDAEFLDHLTQRLQADGFSVVATDDIEDGVRIACQDNVQVVLLGLSSSQQEDLRTLGDLRGACPDSNIIVINRSDSMQLSMEAMKLGVFHELTPPIDMEELEKRLREAREAFRKDQQIGM